MSGTSLLLICLFSFNYTHYAMLFPFSVLKVVLYMQLNCLKFGDFGGKGHSEKKMQKTQEF